MDLYTSVAVGLAEQLTKRYSTSFSAASTLFPQEIRCHIYNIYGLVRIADEVVDTYPGDDKASQLDALEHEAYQAVTRGFSANPIVHAFAVTAKQYGIGKPLIGPFFASMRMDLTPRTYDRETYKVYIYGSAEVVGLMCLKVFCGTDAAAYAQLESGARHLGAAYQKVNFLRDLAADQDDLGRFYFPGTTYATFDDTAKQTVVADIAADFKAARPYIDELPEAARAAVQTSYRYYYALFQALQAAPVARIKHERIRIPNYRKFLLLAPHLLRRRK